MDDAILTARPVQRTQPDARQEPPQEPPSSPPPEKVRAFKLHRLVYRGQVGQVLRVALVNSLLSLLTLGLYRFWARTRLRRYFWSHVELDGDPIEYTGTGRQLFIGFLVVLAVLVPVLFALQHVASLFPHDAWEQGVIILVQGLGLLFLIQYAVFRARRYRLGHTRWRGIRASQTGSALTYAVRAFGYYLLSILTLFLAHPLYRTRTQRYLVQNTHLGTQAFQFEGRAGALFRKWLIFWAFAAFAVTLSLLSGTFEFGTYGGYDGSVSSFEGPLASLPAARFLSFLSIAAAMLLLAWYRAYEFRYFAEVTRFGSVRFASGLKARHVIRIYGLYYVVLGVLSAAIAGVVMVFFFGLGSSLLAGMGQTSPEALATYLNMAMIVVFLVALLFGSALLSLLNPVLIVHPLLKKVVASIKFRGHYNVEDLLQSAKAAESRGEGLADAFDVEVAGF